MSEGKKKWTRSAIACTKCRQMKIRCDASERFPDSCSHCEKAKSFCEIDRNFQRKQSRRISSKKKTNLTSPKSTSRTSIPIQTDSNPLQLDSNIAEFFTKDEVIQNVIIKADTINHLFQVFNTHYYPYVPVFPKEYLNPSLLSSESQILFWTVCSIAAPIGCPSLMYTISEHVKQLLQKQAFAYYFYNPFFAMAHVLSLLLLCYWPLPHKTSQEDVSWVYCGQAIHMGLLIGLHRSSFKNEYILHDTEQQQRQRVTGLIWMTCFHANQLLASFHGLLSTAVLEHTAFSKAILEKSEEDPSLHEFLKQVKILQTLDRCMKALGATSSVTQVNGAADPAIRGLLHKTFEDSFSQLAVDCSPMSKVTEIYYLHSKLQLHCFLLSPDSTAEDQKSVILPVYFVCTQIIKMAKKLVEDNTQDYRAWPIMITRCIIVAAVVLFRISTSNYKHHIDEEIARNSISDAYSIFRRISIEPKDTPGRCINLLNGLSNMLATNSLSNEICTVYSRLGAGIFCGMLMDYKKWAAANDHTPNAPKIMTKDELNGKSTATLINTFEADTSSSSTVDLSLFAGADSLNLLLTMDEMWDWSTWPSLTGTDVINVPIDGVQPL
ncbi:hypothetical protein K501DRAFT_319357 [Backusella circina FSU 941]|nr:hypothetical protein K501DRAFT_319357 [Backusella circina FSU 941]